MEGTRRRSSVANYNSLDAPLPPLDENNVVQPFRRHSLPLSELEVPLRPTSVPVTNIDAVIVGTRQTVNGGNFNGTSGHDALTSSATTIRPGSLRAKSGKHSGLAQAAMSNPKSVVVTSKDSLLCPPMSMASVIAMAAANGGSNTPMRSSDTPLSTAPSSPKMLPNSPRLHATTLNIPGVTRSKVSLDGRIPNRDLGAKLIIVMVGLPARGKSYITKKLSRYLNWLQYNVEIFNVGNRRRVAAKEPHPDTPPHESPILTAATKALRELRLDGRSPPSSGFKGTGLLTGAHSPPKLTLTNDEAASVSPDLAPSGDKDTMNDEDGISQSAEFFDPTNKKASKIREKVAMETLDEALEYLISGGGNVAILDATNSTKERRKALVDQTRIKAGDQLQILFIESVCEDEKILEANMRLKLSGPDYKDQDPVKAYADFKRRVQMYEGAYAPLGLYEEQMGWQYIKLIDVGRKFVAHGTRGFLANHTAYYLMNFNLAPRQIWITRHGESTDNVLQRIGGDASLTEKGDKYAKALAEFIEEQRKIFHTHLLDKHAKAQLPPRGGDITPPNPETSEHFVAKNDGDGYIPNEKNFCVWTSMLRRSMETAKYFNDEEFDVKEWRILDELNAGRCDGMTYEEIKVKYPEEYASRREDKLAFRYPGPGGESYMDVIHRMKELIVEVERMVDHVILVGHRVVARVLLAYFMGLNRNDVAHVDIPLGRLYVLEPRPYGVDFKAWNYDSATNKFIPDPDYKLVVSEEEKYQRDVARQEAVAKRARSASLSKMQQIQTADQTPISISMPTPTPLQNASLLSTNMPKSDSISQQSNGNGNGDGYATSTNGLEVAVPVATKATVMSTMQSPMRMEQKVKCSGEGENKKMMQVNGTAWMNGSVAR